MEEIKLTALEQERYDIIRSCIAGDITNKEASVRLGLKVRQVQRIKRTVESEKRKGVVHKSKGRASGNATSDDTVEKVAAFFKQKKHSDFGPTFAQEKLAGQGVVLNTETLRLLMIKKGLRETHPRRGPQIVREWRERKECFGELVQFDGSYHDWFENGEKECLLAAIDDATSRIVKAVFEDNEGVHAVFRFWWSYMEAQGRPVAIYLDKFSTYKINHKNAVHNPEFMTQFQRAMKELSVRVICANSPQAKGRVERLFGTLQDRMVKEMRLRDIKTRDVANKYIHEEYTDVHNKRFGVPAQSTVDAHRPLSDDLRTRLPAIFSVQSKRKVNNDYTIQFKNKWFQLEATQDTAVYKRDEVIVEERFDDTLHVRMKNTYLKYRELPRRPKPLNVPVVALTKRKPDWKPPENHPWRKLIL
ncbi:MAG: ISNCY family transposase [Minisyncoccia bacterium]